jgi:hypothetical protein
VEHQTVSVRISQGLPTPFFRLQKVRDYSSQLSSIIRGSSSLASSGFSSESTESHKDSTNFQNDTVSSFLQSGYRAESGGKEQESQYQRRDPVLERKKGFVDFAGMGNDTSCYQEPSLQSGKIIAF